MKCPKEKIIKALQDYDRSGEGAHAAMLDILNILGCSVNMAVKTLIVSWFMSGGDKESMPRF